ncbi:MAG: SseB family protein [Bilifractor sp.]|jgi:hypothetical protein
MAIDMRFEAKRFLKFDQILALYSTATNLPFVECDDKTFCDQVYVFTKEETLQEYARIFRKDQYGLKAFAFPNDKFQMFFDQLYAMGVDTIQLVDEGAPVPVKLPDLAAQSKFPDLPDGLPKTNPEVQLTAAYFMQGARRHMEFSQDEKKHLRDLEEEMAVNLVRSSFIVAFDTSQVKGKWNPADKRQKVGIPYIKNKAGKVFFPVYSDFYEFRRFNSGNRNMKLSITAVDYDALPKIIRKPAEAFVFNPASINLSLTVEQLREMKRRYVTGG